MLQGLAWLKIDTSQAVDAALEDLDGRRGVGRKLGERHEFLGQMRDERGLNQSRLDEIPLHKRC